MVSAYVMFKAYSGVADRLKSNIETLDGVRDVHIVAGDVDLIATVDVDEPAEVKEIAATGVQGVDGVESTQTYIAME
jgi:DNA-binding Lrp family transcriptional regulator